MRKSLFSVGILIAASLNAASPALANDFDAIAITVATQTWTWARSPTSPGSLPA